MSAPPKKMGLSLYADLLEPDKQKSAGATISSGPVKYDVKTSGGDEEAQRKKDASLKFQPIKRPQVQHKAKPKSATSSSMHKFSSSIATISASSPDRQIPTSTPQQQPSVQKSNFEDWVGDEDEFYYHERRDYGNRKKKQKKNKPQERVWDWDDIYDPTLPNNYADYKGSEEQSREIRDWKARLYYHQLKEAKRAGKNGAAYSDDEVDRRPRPMNTMFAPPFDLNFAPPIFNGSARPPRVDDDDDYHPEDVQSTTAQEDDTQYEPPAAFTRTSMQEDASGEDAYARRMQMSGAIPNPVPRQQLAENVVVPTPPPAVSKTDADVEAKRAEAQAKIAAFKAKLQKKQPNESLVPADISVAPAVQETVVPAVVSEFPVAQPPPPPPPPEEPGAVISRAPVRYQVPAAPPEPAASEDTAMNDNEHQDATPTAEQIKSSRPGQKGFAERLLKKYGWEKGQGLGAQGEGITTAIVAKAEKRKKLPDAEGGKWAAPANMGKIVGGKKRKLDPSATETENDSHFGKMSEVIKLEGMLDGMDVQKEIEENNLMQEVGDEMGSNYGNVERVFIWREEMGGKNEVFVKFTSQLSALRALNAQQGMMFADNEVKARFWDVEMFDAGQYA